MKARPIRYSDEGKVTVLLVPEDTKLRGVVDFNRSTLETYLTFPATKSLHIYCISQENFEEVIALIRFVKSLYNVDVFCYCNSDVEKSFIQVLKATTNGVIPLGI